jgi:hypothetical protein
MVKRAVDFSNLPGDTRWTDPQLAAQLARQERMAAEKAYLKGSRNPAIVANRWLGLPVSMVGGTPVKALEGAATFPGRLAETFGPGGTVSTGKESYLSENAIGLGREGAGFQFGGAPAPAGALAAGRSRLARGPVKAEGVLRAEAPALKEGTVLDPHNPPVTFKGKEPKDWTAQDFHDFGVLHGTQTPLGPKNEADWRAGLRSFKTNEGRDFTIPAGTAKDPFTYYDTLHMKAQGLDPNNLPPELHREIHDRSVAATAPQGKPTAAQTFNQLVFGLTSPNAPLTPNLFTVARMMPKEGTTDIQRLAGATPWKIEDAAAQKGGAGSERNLLSRDIAAKAAVNKRSEGGIGTVSTSDLTRVSDLGKLFEKDPGKGDWFLFKGAEEGGGTPSEHWGNYLQRLSAQVPGLSMKTGSLGSVFQDPMKAATSAIDRHIARQFTDEMFPSQQAADDFRATTVKKWNADNADKKVTAFDQLPRSAHDDAMFAYLNAHPGMQYRMKGGEKNPNLPGPLAQTKFIEEPKGSVETMSPAYSRTLDTVAGQAAQHDQSVFQRQWYLWDLIRKRNEPHEVMNPNLTSLPRMSKDQAMAARDAHNEAGYLAASGQVRPVDNPSSLAVFSAPGAPAQPFSGTWGPAPPPEGQPPPAAVPPGLLNNPEFWKQWQQGGGA